MNIRRMCAVQVLTTGKASNSYAATSRARRFSNERLSINRDGNAVLKLETPWRISDWQYKEMAASTVKHATKTADWPHDVLTLMMGNIFVAHLYRVRSGSTAPDWSHL